MNRDIFVLVVKHLLTLQTDGDLRTWVKWAEDCVAMGQYAGFRELPQNKAVEKWLDSYYHVFSAIQSEFGKETAVKVLNLSQEKLCLYPYEMRAAVRVIKSGGTGKDILQMIVEGTLEDQEPDVPEHCEKEKIGEADTWSCNTENWTVSCGVCGPGRRTRKFLFCISLGIPWQNSFSTPAWSCCNMIMA